MTAAFCHLSLLTPPNNHRQVTLKGCQYAVSTPFFSQSVTHHRAPPFRLLTLSAFHLTVATAGRFHLTICRRLPLNIPFVWPRADGSLVNCQVCSSSSSFYGFPMSWEWAPLQICFCPYLCCGDTCITVCLRTAEEHNAGSGLMVQLDRSIMSCRPLDSLMSSPSTPGRMDSPTSVIVIKIFPLF